jgi:cytochrome P450
MQFTYKAPTPARSKGKLPPTLPLPRALQTLACRLWPLAYFECNHTRYGNRFTIHPVDMPPLVFLSDPQEIRAVLTAPPGVLHAGAGGAVVAPLFGEESFTMCEAEEEHTCGRNAILPAFSRRVTREHEEIVAEIVRLEVASWPIGSAFTTYPHLRALTLRVIMRSVFGGGGPAFEELHERLLGMISVMASFLLQEPRLRHLPGWRAKWKRFVRKREEVDRSIFALVALRRGSHGQSGDLLDRLLAARNPDGSPMSERQIRDNLVTVLVAGHETTASQLAWALQLLAHSPAVQARLIEEIDGETGEEYLTATVQETLRHRPVFPFAAPRAVLQPIEIGELTYRPPTQLLACAYLVHHDPALYPNPQEFRPERFLDSPPNSRIWLPWGGGRRRCLGQHYAMLEMQTVLRAVLASRLVLPAGRHIERARWRSVIVTPHAGSRVILQRRAPRKQSVPIGTHLFYSERIPGYPAEQAS